MGRMKEVFMEDLERKEFEAELRAVNERIHRILESKDRLHKQNEKPGETAHNNKAK